MSVEHLCPLLRINMYIYIYTVYGLNIYPAASSIYTAESGADEKSLIERTSS